MKVLNIKVDKERVAEIEKAFVREQALKNLLNENMNSDAPAVKIIVDSYTEAFSKRQILMNSLEADVLGDYADKFPHEISVLFSSSTMVVTTGDDTLIPQEVFNMDEKI